MQKKFCTRREAGTYLVQRLKDYADRTDVLVLALPNNGIPVAYEVAAALNLDLDVLPVCRIDVPADPAVTLGAVAQNNIFIRNDEMIGRYHLAEDQMEKLRQEAYFRLEKWDSMFHAGKEVVEFEHRTVILIDDGIETGATIRAAIAAIGWVPDSVVVAVPLVSKRVCKMIADEVDEVITLIMPQDPVNAAAWYDEAADVTDNEALELLNRPRHGVMSKAGFYAENVSQ